MSEKPRGLGRGLSALLGDDESDDLADLDRRRQMRTVSVDLLRPGRYQPRMEFDEEKLADLAESIREKGVLQPLLVRRDQIDPNRFEIIAGERRWRAAQLAQLHEVPVLVKDFSDAEALEVALVENLQRQDLSAIEEARGYRRLMEEFEHTQEDLARVVGKSRSHVANTLRLLNLPDAVQSMVEDGRISAGHARALLTAPDPENLASEVVRKGLSVRQTEQMVQKPVAKERKNGAGAPKGRPMSMGEHDADTAALERDLQAVLGLRVSIRFQGRGGDLTIHYESLEQLDDILRRLNAQPGMAGGGGMLSDYEPQGRGGRRGMGGPDMVELDDVLARLGMDDAGEEGMVADDDDTASMDEVYANLQGLIDKGSGKA